jgi:hypothetical protein
MKAKVAHSRALVVLGEAEIPAALAWAFRAGQLQSKRPPPPTQKRRPGDPQLMASASDQSANPRQTPVDRVPAVNPNLQAKKEHE